MRWAIVNKGPYRLHPSLQHFEMAEEDWLLMSRGEKDSYIKMVLNSNVALTSELKETENHTDAIQVDESDHYLSMSGLSVLAEAALSELSHGKESSEPTDETKQTPMITLDEFRKYFNTQPMVLWRASTRKQSSSLERKMELFVHRAAVKRREWSKAVD